MKWNPLPWLVGRSLWSELPQWTAAGIIQAEQERRIGEHLDRPCCGIDITTATKITLCAMAAFALVLAVVLVTCDQWEFIPFAAKIDTTAVGALACYGAGYWFRFHRDTTKQCDGWFLAGSLLYGACVWLIFERDHLLGMYPWVFFFWAAGVLPLAWVLSSSLMLSLSCVLGSIWVVWHIAVSGSATFTSLFVALAMCLFHWAYTNRSRGVLTLSLLSFVLWWSMLAVASDLGRQGFFWVAGLGPVLYLIGLRHDDDNSFADTYKKVGLGLTAAVLLALAMPSVTADLMTTGHLLRYWLCGVTAAGVLVAVVPLPRLLDWRGDWPALAVLAAVTLVPGLLGVATLALLDERATTAASIGLAALFNAGAVAVSAALVLHGATSRCMGSLALGASYFLVWVVAIGFDLAGQLRSAALILAIAAATLLVIVRIWSRKQNLSNEAVTSENV